MTYRVSQIPGIQANPDKLRELIQQPQAIPEFITPKMQQELVDEFWKRYDRQTGASITITFNQTDDPVLKILSEVLYSHVDPTVYQFVSATYVRLLDRPGPHIDSGLIKDGPFKFHNVLDSVAGKQIFLPLAANDDVTCPQDDLTDLVTIYTNQRWYGYGTNFLKGDDKPREWQQFNRKEIYDYQGMMDYDPSGFDSLVFDKYLKGFVKPEAMEGMTCGDIVQWRLRQGALFDTSQIHMASDANITKIKSKLFLNLHYFYRNPGQLL